MNLKNEIEKKANFWLIRQKEGLTSFEQKEFEFWLENKHHKKIYEENRTSLTPNRKTGIEIDDYLKTHYSVIPINTDEANKVVVEKCFHLLFEKHTIVGIHLHRLCLISEPSFQN